MDIMLERILSLVPDHHGGDKEFALSIGYKSGNIIADWRAGRSKSYKGKIREISRVYEVSIDWLCGNSQKNNPPAKSEGLSEVKIEFMDAVKQMSDERVLQLMYVLGLKKENPAE